MLVAGADTSNNFEYVSIIVGEETDVDRIFQKYDMPHIHVTKIASRKQKLKVVKSLVLDGNVRSACFKIDRPSIIRDIEDRRNRENIYGQTKKIAQQFNWALRNKINQVFSEFVTSNGSSITDLFFQVDQDLEQTFKSTGLKIALTSRAHELADVIGWANYNRIPNTMVLEYDFATEIHQYVLNHCGRS